MIWRLNKEDTSDTANTKPVSQIVMSLSSHQLILRCVQEGFIFPPSYSERNHNADIVIPASQFALQQFSVYL